MTALYVRRTLDLDADKAKYRIQGIYGTATAGTTTHIDYQFTEERWITGGSLITNNAVFGDSADLVIIDKDNILGYGANTILDTFVDNFYMKEDMQCQGLFECPYPALIVTGLYLRISYTSTGGTDVKVAYNMISHIPRS